MAQLVRKFPCMAILLGLSQYLSGQVLLPYLENGLYGFADSTGRVITEPIYDQVTEFGIRSVFFSEIYNTRKVHEDDNWPKNLALGYKNKLWYLIGKNGKSLLGEGVKGKIKITKDGTTSPYKIITTDTLADGWGIWDEQNGGSQGLIYTYSNSGSPAGPTSSTLDKQNHDLNPNRAGFSYCPTPYINIQGCECKKVHRKDGTYDILSKYNEVLHVNYHPLNKSSWQQLSRSDRKTLENAELHRTCQKAYPYRKLPYRSRSSKKAIPRKQRWNDKLSMAESQQHLLDSMLLLTGRTYDRAIEFHMGHLGYWTCGQDKAKSRIDIINEKGKIVHEAKATKIPKSIMQNNFAMSGYVYIRSEENQVLIDKEGKKVFRPDQYADIIWHYDVAFAFLKKDSAYPFHIYDKEWNLVLDYEIHGLTQSNVALVKKNDGSFSRKILDSDYKPLETIEDVDFELVLLEKGNQFRPPELLNDRKPVNSSDQENLHYLDMDRLYAFNGRELSNPAKTLVDDLKNRKSNSWFTYRNRKSDKKPLHRFFTSKQGVNQRVVCLDFRKNHVMLDTIVQEFLAYNSCNAEVEVIMNGDTLFLPLAEQNKSFFKFKIGGMYKMLNGEYEELRAADNSLITRVTIKNGVKDNIKMSVLNHGKYLIYLNDKNSAIIDADGKILKTIERTDRRWKKSKLGQLSFKNPQEFEIIHKKYLKIYGEKPYLINLKSLVEYRA